jgi:hypothetical protein
LCTIFINRTKLRLLLVWLNFHKSEWNPIPMTFTSKQRRKRSVCMVVLDQISLTKLHIHQSQAISQEVFASSISLNRF